MGISSKVGHAFSVLWGAVVGFKNFIKSAFLESDGTTSSSRIMMFLFSCFSMWLLWRIFWHVFRLTDTAALSIWLANVPLLIAALCGLIVLPYTINKGSEAMQSTFNGIASMMNAAKSAQTNTALTGTVGAAILQPPPPTPPAPAVGSSGVKG